MRRTCFFLLFLFLFLGLMPGVVLALPQIPPQNFVQVSSAILFDLDNDAILFEQNADEPIPPASLTKVLSMFLALDHVHSGQATFDAAVAVSASAASAGGSRMGLRKNETVPLRELLLGMAVSSGNDASVAVAEFVGGSSQAFVNMMNVKARKLGMRQSVFRNPHGLPAEGQYTTARDMLTLARAYLKAYPWALAFHNTRVLNHLGRVTWNKNPLLDQYPGADGLKTGWIRASGYNLIFTARRGNRRLLAVILGAPDARSRGNEACRLLDAGFKVCDEDAVSVSVALAQMPEAGYQIDLDKNAQDAWRRYPHAQRVKQGKGKAGRRVGADKKQKGKMAGKAKLRQKTRHSVQNSRQVKKPGKGRPQQKTRHSVQNSRRKTG